MCGRFVLSSKNKIKNKYNFKIKENYNITPGSDILIIDKNFLLLKIRWGFFPKQEGKKVKHYHSQKVVPLQSMFKVRITTSHNYWQTY